MELDTEKIVVRQADVHPVAFKLDAIEIGVLSKSR